MNNGQYANLLGQFNELNSTFSKCLEASANKQDVDLSEQLDRLNSALSKLLTVIDSSWWEKLFEPITIVVFAVAIFAFMQWKTSEKQRTQELFDKRFNLYERVFSLFYQKQVNRKNIEEADLLPYANEANFLFDEEVAKHIINIASYSGNKLDYDWFNKPFEKYMRVK